LERTEDASNEVDSLTPDQRETLRRALEMGYLSVPREASLVDLAGELGRSEVDVSRQLRRGMAILVRASEDG